MRFIAAAVALFASLALAQQNAISIPEGQSTLDVTAGQPITIEWTNPSSGTVTIKLQESGPNITPESGIIVASGIPASDGTATFIIDADSVNTFQYTIQIIDDTNPDNYNFSPNFGIQGATGTATGSATSGSVTSTATDSTATDSTATDSTATDSTITSTSGSSTASATSTETTSEEETSTSSSAEASESTSAPSSSDNGAAGLKVQGGLVAAIAVAIAVL